MKEVTAQNKTNILPKTKNKKGQERKRKNTSMKDKMIFYLHMHKKI